MPGELKKLYAFGGLLNKKYLVDIQNQNIIPSVKGQLSCENFV